MIKRFLEWIRLKERLHSSIYLSPLFNEAEIWWCAIGENIGVEINGKSKHFTRPVLIFKKLSRDSFLGIPMSTQPKDGTWYTMVRHGGKDVTIILSQLRIFSSNRLYEKVGELDGVDCQKVALDFTNLYLISNKKFSPLVGGVVGKSQKYL
jgi:hypothetical protein